MLAHRPGVTLAEAVVEPLVVRVVESLLLEGPLQIPVDLGHEAEVRNPCPHLLGRLRPERLGLDGPGSLEDLRQDQHGHVAAHAVALPGDAHELLDHRVLKRRVAVVELQGVGPTSKVRIAAVGQQQVAALALDPDIIRRRSGLVPFGPGDVVLGMTLDPRVIQARFTRLPHAQEPDPVEAHLRNAVQLDVRNVVERGRPSDDAGQLCQPDPGVDLEQRRIAVARHDFSAASMSTYPILPASSIFSGSMVAKRCIMRAMTPVQPVWWLAPRPAPLSPWKYS